MDKYIIFKGTDLIIELNKVVSIDVSKKMFILEEMKNGGWRLTYTKSLFDFKDLNGLKIINGEMAESG